MYLDVSFDDIVLPSPRKSVYHPQPMSQWCDIEINHDRSLNFEHFLFPRRSLCSFPSGTWRRCYIAMFVLIYCYWSRSFLMNLSYEIGILFLSWYLLSYGISILFVIYPSIDYNHFLVLCVPPVSYVCFVSIYMVTFILSYQHHA